MTGAGNIYDLGYRSYDGPRLGRSHAMRALFSHTLRSAFGVGRGGRAKMAPIVLAVLAVIPAVITVGALAIFRSAVGREEFIQSQFPIQHSNYYGIVMTLVALFCAAQAPEVFGRDQRYSLLPLYFSRALRRTDYALARFAGLAAAVLSFVLLPQLLILVGFVLSADDVGAQLADELAFVPAILLQGLLLAALLGAISAAVSSFTPRRAYATTGIVVLLAVTPVISAVLLELGTISLATLFVLLSPADILDATNAWLFDTFPESSSIRLSDLPLEAFAVTAVVIIAVCLAVLVRRYQTIAA